MITTVEIHNKELPEQRGLVTYDDQTKQVIVDFPKDIDKQEEIREYLLRPQTFWIPESQRIDDYREETALPVDAKVFFDLAMCTLWANTEISVDWATEKNMR